ncbi:DUF6290 family protein [Orbaceae bacterium ac157xtp]
MPTLNIRVDESTKAALQEVAKFNGETLSSLGLRAINEMLENEFDMKLAQEALAQRTANEKSHPIETLFAEYEL